MYMFGIRSLAPSIAVCLLCIGCAGTPGVDTDAEVSQIRDLHSEWLTAFAEKDIEGAMVFFAPEAVLMPAHAPAVVGKEAIQEWFESWLPNPAISSVFSPDEIEVADSGDLAYDRGTFRFTMDTPDGLVRDSGKYVIVWKKIHGKWMAILDISNSDMATPEVIPIGDPNGVVEESAEVDR